MIMCLDLTGDVHAVCRLTGVCERVKRILQVAQQTTVEIDSLYDGIDFSMPITCPELPGHWDLSHGTFQVAEEFRTVSTLQCRDNKGATYDACSGPVATEPRRPVVDRLCHKDICVTELANCKSMDGVTGCDTDVVNFTESMTVPGLYRDAVTSADQHVDVKMSSQPRVTGALCCSCTVKLVFLSLVVLLLLTCGYMIHVQLLQEVTCICDRFSWVPANNLGLPKCMAEAPVQHSSAGSSAVL